MFVDVGAKFPPFSWIWFRRLGEWQLARTEVRHAAREIHFRRTIRQFPISTSTAQFYFQRFDDLSVRDSEVTPEDEAGTVYLDLRHEPRDLELEARRWRQVSRCQNIFRWVPNIFSTVAAMSRPPAGPLRGLGPPLRRMRRGLHTRPLLMSGYSEYIFKACRVFGELFV